MITTFSMRVSGVILGESIVSSVHYCFTSIFFFISLAPVASIGLIEALLDGRTPPVSNAGLILFYNDASFFFVFFVKREAHTASEVLLCM